MIVFPTKELLYTSNNKKKEVEKMKKIDNLLIKAKGKCAVDGNGIESGVLSKKKKGADDIIYKVGFIAVSIAVIVLWKTGVLSMANTAIGNMTEQVTNFFTGN